MLAIDKPGLGSRRRWVRVRLGKDDFLAGFGVIFGGVFGFARGDYLRLCLDRRPARSNGALRSNPTIR